MIVFSPGPSAQKREPLRSDPSTLLSPPRSSIRWAAGASAEPSGCAPQRTRRLTPGGMVSAKANWRPVAPRRNCGLTLGPASRRTGKLRTLPGLRTRACALGRSLPKPAGKASSPAALKRSAPACPMRSRPTAPAGSYQNGSDASRLIVSSACDPRCRPAPHESPCRGSARSARTRPSASVAVRMPGRARRPLSRQGAKAAASVARLRSKAARSGPRICTCSVTMRGCAGACSAVRSSRSGVPAVRIAVSGAPCPATPSSRQRGSRSMRSGAPPAGVQSSRTVPS